jgi:hypothetical protein
VATPEHGLSIKGQPLPNLPSSVRAAFTTKREAPATAVRSDLIEYGGTSWVVEGSHSIRFTVAKDAGLSLSLNR